MLYALLDVYRPATLEACRDDVFAMSALGGCVWWVLACLPAVMCPAAVLCSYSPVHHASPPLGRYLRRLLLDEELLSLRQFARFDPSSADHQAEFLVLDGQTLQNLEVR